MELALGVMGSLTGVFVAMAAWALIVGRVPAKEFRTPKSFLVGLASKSGFVYSLVGLAVLFFIGLAAPPTFLHYFLVVLVTSTWVLTMWQIAEEA